jgi:class 3 adenylate cyclase/tetratricopeptide (TPR) repeat protein
VREGALNSSRKTPDRPQGTVTFLFTDIEGSTELLNRLGERYSDVLAVQRQILREKFRRWDGQEIDTQGDSFFVSFTRATNAVSAVVEIQRELDMQVWPDDAQVRVRMGLHTGEPWVAEEGYVGIDVHRAARIGTIGHGGQVLLSETTTALVKNSLPDGVVLRDLGRHRLKNIQYPEHIRQLVIEGVPSDFPELNSLEVLPIIEYESREIQFYTYLEKEEVGAVPKPLFVARERELDMMGDFLEKALSGEGQVVFVSGDPGIGKTALVEEFAHNTLATHPGLLFGMGASSSIGGMGDPYSPFREAMNMLIGDFRACLNKGTIDAEYARRSWEAFPRILEIVLDFGSYLIGPLINGSGLLSRAKAILPEGDLLYRQLKQEISRTPTGQTNLDQSSLFEQFTNVVRVIGETHPLMFVLDDMQWADPASIALLFHVGRRIAEAGVMLVCTYRPGDVGRGRGEEQHPLESVLSEFKRTHGDIWVDLEYVEEGEGRAFINQFLDTEPNQLDDEFREALYQRTEGHPLFTVELLRDLQEREELTKNSENEWTQAYELDWDRMPERVEGAIEERINRLDSSLHELLNTASVEGMTFTAQVAAKILSTPEGEVLGSVSRELVKRHRLVHERDTYQVDHKMISRFSFSHALIQQYLYNHLGRGEQIHLHGETARAMEHLYKDDLDSVIVQLAHHYTEAGDGDAAVRYLVKAGADAKEKRAYGEALAYLNRAMDFIPPTDRQRRWNVLLERSSVLVVLGERKQRDEDVSELLMMAEEEQDDLWIAEAYMRKAHDISLTGDVRGELEAHKTGLAAAERCNNDHLTADIQSMMVKLYVRIGEEDRAEKIVKAIYEKYLPKADDHTAARVLTNLSLYYGEIGDIGKTIHLTSEAVKITQQVNEQYGESIGYSNLGYQYAQLGMYEASKAALSESITLSEKIGSRRTGSYARLNLGLVYLRMGNYPDALQELERAIRELDDIGDSMGEAWGKKYLSLVYEKMGDESRALQEFIEVQEKCQEMGVVGIAIEASAGAARAALSLGDVEQARDRASEVWEYLIVHSSARLEFPASVYLTCASVFSVLNDERSTDALNMGYEDIMARAGKISDEEMREAYIHNVPENRELVDLMEESKTGSD